MPARAEKPSGPATEFDARGVINQGIEQLMTELRAGKSERLEQYLAFAARFHHYSAYNQMLIFMQQPQATYVAGYKTWQEMGYQVRRGEKGIRILAPRTRKQVDAETQEKKQSLYFVTVSVFDAAQIANTKEKPLPEFFTPLADDQPELYARLARIVAADGIALSEGSTGRAQGYSAGKRIVLREGLDSRTKVLTLVHEYAHEILHRDEKGRHQSRQVKECHAEAIAYVVAHRYGIRNPFSADYLHHWGNTPKQLLAELETVRHAAAYIIDRIDKYAADPQATAASPRISTMPS
jgi:antirestriction protein ArdC